MQPSASRALRCSPSASLNSLARREAMVEPGSKTEGERRLALPYHEGDGHGFAEGATEPQHDGADDADPRLRQQHVAHHLPGCAANAVGALAHHRRNLVEHV